MCFHSNTRRARCSCVKVLERVKNKRKSGFDPLPHITILPTTGITIKKGWASTLWHIHLPTILLCTRVIRSTNTCTPASTMSAPVTSGQIVSALSMPSAKWLVAFWAVVAKPPGKWSHKQFTAWSDQPLVTLLPHTFLHTPLKKFLRLPARRSCHFVPDGLGRHKQEHIRAFRAAKNTIWKKWVKVTFYSQFLHNTFSIKI